ncbi:MAG: YkgJ family cysteine cluster protein [Promethearchaeota archaeon]
MENKCENCGKCCLQTEMMLSKQDIDLIIKFYPKQIRKQDIAFINENGNFQIKNLNNHCIFLDFSTKKCNIYNYRPQGCRYYPLIYDSQKKDCVYDKDCPRIHLFYQDKAILTKTCENLRNFLKIQLKINLG